VEAGILANFLYIEITKILSALYRFGWITCNLACDGATESRSAMRVLGTHTTLEVMGDYLSVHQRMFCLLTP